MAESIPLKAFNYSVNYLDFLTELKKMTATMLLARC